MEARGGIDSGAEELDMVMNIGAFKSKDYDVLKQDIGAVVNAKRNDPEIIVKKS